MTDSFMQSAAKPTFVRSATALLGPADADHYRVKVGRYGDRWYTDPLPADDTWPALDATFPSISTVKKASGSDWSFVALKRVAEANTDVKDMTFEMRYETFKTQNKVGLSAAGKRGTNIHLYAESKLHGNPVRIADGAPGYEYMPSVDAWFDQYQPELIAAEYVVINRTLNGIGYGGTPDGLLRIDGELYAIDWKSRGADSDHGAYPEEAEQIAAGHRGDYMIVRGNRGPERRPIPAVAGGLVISIRPDGCRTYPIDIDKAATQWEARHAWWVARRDERAPIGRQWAVRGPQAAPPPQMASSIQTMIDPYRAAVGQTDRVLNLRARCRKIVELSPKGGDWLKTQMRENGVKLTGEPDDEQLSFIENLVQRAEAEVSAPFADLPPEKPTPPQGADDRRLSHIVRDIDEGVHLKADEPAVVEMRTKYAALDAASRSWLEAIVQQSIIAGRSIHMGGGHTTMRRVRIVTGLATLALSEQETAA